MKSFYDGGLGTSILHPSCSRACNHRLRIKSKTNLCCRVKIGAVLLSILMVLAIFANLTIISTSNQNIPPQVLRYIDTDTENIEEISRIGDQKSPHLIIYKVNPSGDILIYDLAQGDILGGIYWKGDELYLRDRLSQYLYQKNNWYKEYVYPIITKHEYEHSVVLGLRSVGNELAKGYEKKELVAWTAGSIAFFIVVTIVTGGVGGAVAIAFYVFATALDLYLTTVEILNKHKFAYENYPAATFAMMVLLGTQDHSNKEVDQKINRIKSKLLAHTDNETREILEELSTEGIWSLMKSSPSLFVETLASYIATLKYARTVNPRLVDKTLEGKGLNWDTVKNFATNEFYKILKLFKGGKVADDFRKIIVRFDKTDFASYYNIRQAPIKGVGATMLAAVVSWAVEGFVGWWLGADKDEYAMLNVVGHAEPLISISQYVLESADTWNKAQFCSSDVSLDSIPCVPPSMSSISSLMFYDQLYESNWIEFWNITYTNDKVAEVLSKRSDFKKWVKNYFNKEINDKNSLKSFAKERVESHMEELISLMANLAKISIEVEDELNNYRKTLKKRIPMAIKGEQRGSNIVLVLDKSGSMNQELTEDRKKIDLAKDASSRFVEMVSENDKIGVVTFSTNAELAIRLTTDRRGIINIINRIVAEGSTAMGDGMRLALDILEDIPLERRVVILLTDGCHNAGTETPETVLEDAKEMKIPIFTIGIGTGNVRDPSHDECFNPDILQKISNETGATFYWINPAVGVDELELWRIYAKIVLGIIDVKSTSVFSDVVMPNDVKSHTFEVGDNVERLVTMLSYRGSKLNLELISPDGDVIDGSGPNVIFLDGRGRILAIISSPQPGRWEARVIGVDVPREGEPYMLSLGINALSISPRELFINADQLGREIRLTVKNEGEITASNVTVHIDGPLRDYIYVNPLQFTLEREKSVTLTVKVSKPDNFAKRSGRIILDNNGFRYVIPVNLIIKGLIINAWTDSNIHVGERAVLNVAVFDDLYSSIIGAKVVAAINGESLILHDDGAPPDTTADDGLYTGYLTLTSSTPITLNIRAEKDNYLPAFMSLSLRALELKPLNLRMSFPHQLTKGDLLIINSTLLDVDGNRVDGASIEAIIDGVRHKFIEITPGFYQLKIDTTNASQQLLLQIEATKRGFQPAKKNITITILGPLSGVSIPSINDDLIILLITISLFTILILAIAYSYSQRGVVCTSCGFRNRRDTIYCRNCGKRLRS